MSFKEWLHEDRTLEECIIDLKKANKELLEEFAKALGLYKLMDWLEVKLELLTRR